MTANMQPLVWVYFQSHPGTGSAFVSHFQNNFDCRNRGWPHFVDHESHGLTTSFIDHGWQWIPWAWPHVFSMLLNACKFYRPEIIFGSHGWTWSPWVWLHIFGLLQLTTNPMDWAAFLVDCGWIYILWAWLRFVLMWFNMNPMVLTASRGCTDKSDQIFHLIIIKLGDLVEIAFIEIHNILSKYTSESCFCFFKH